MTSSASTLPKQELPLTAELRVLLQITVDGDTGPFSVDNWLQDVFPCLIIVSMADFKFCSSVTTFVYRLTSRFWS